MWMINASLTHLTLAKMLSWITCVSLVSIAVVLVYCDIDSNTIELLNSTPRDGLQRDQTVLSVVSLKQKSFIRSFYSHFCSGTIVGKEWILTAGHCFTNKNGVPLDHLVVDIGTVQLSNANGTRYPISNYYIHPNQSESIEIYKNDLCLIKLQRPIIFTSNIQAVHFGTIKDQRELPVMAGGWGRVSQYGSLHKILRYIHFNTLRYEECKRLHDRRNNIVDRAKHICGYGGLGKSLCFGDSGGPLFDEATGYQVGVFSALEDCSGNYPVLFMRIESYLDWINSVTKLDLTID